MALEVVDNRKHGNVRFDGLSVGEFFIHDGELHIKTDGGDLATCLADAVHYPVGGSTVVVKVDQVKISLE